MYHSLLKKIRKGTVQHIQKKLEPLLVAMACMCPQLWKSVSEPYLQPPWCKCGNATFNGGSGRVRRSSFEPPFLVLWRPFATSLYSSVVLPRLNIGRYPFAIHSKRIGQYPLVSVDQVRFCGELLFFFLIFFFFFPSSFFFFPPFL